GPLLCGCGRIRAPRRIWCAECAAEQDEYKIQLRAERERRPRKIRRPMTLDEFELVMALQDYCAAGHWLPLPQWDFLQNIGDYGPITDKQGDYIRSLAAKYGVARSRKGSLMTDERANAKVLS